MCKRCAELELENTKLKQQIVQLQNMLKLVTLRYKCFDDDPEFEEIYYKRDDVLE